MPTLMSKEVKIWEQNLTAVYQGCKGDNTIDFHKEAVSLKT